MADNDDTTTEDEGKADAAKPDAKAAAAKADAAKADDGKADDGNADAAKAAAAKADDGKAAAAKADDGKAAAAKADAAKADAKPAKAAAKPKADAQAPSVSDDKPAKSTAAKVELVNPVAAQMAKWRLFAIVSVISLILDQATKIWARHALPVTPDGCQGGLDVVDALMARKCIGLAKPVIDGYWDWRLSMNPGSAFGLFSGTGAVGRVLLSIVGILAVGGMIWMLRKARPDQRVLHWALAFVAGGAVGNLIDRIYFGVVTDFVLWRYQTKEWPVFNIADVVLVVGVGLMFIDIQKEGKKDKAAKKLRQEKARAAGLVKDLEKR